MLLLLLLPASIAGVRGRVWENCGRVRWVVRGVPRRRGHVLVVVVRSGLLLGVVLGILRMDGHSPATMLFVSVARLYVIDVARGVLRVRVVGIGVVGAGVRASAVVDGKCSRGLHYSHGRRKHTGHAQMEAGSVTRDATSPSLSHTLHTGWSSRNAQRYRGASC